MDIDRQKTLRDTVLLLAGMLEDGDVDSRMLESVLRRQSKRLPDPSERLSKSELLSFYLMGDCDGGQKGDLSSAGGTPVGDSLPIPISPDIRDRLVKLLRSKPRRTASGVATVTVLMKPWPCGGDCICCPNDIRMPKSYLSDEPACQRAERWWFDPYLQVASRIRVLEDMGHNTDKVELIVLGGTFDDYPEGYRIWFVEQLFECLNDIGSADIDSKMQDRISLYESAQQELEAGDPGDGDDASKPGFLDIVKTALKLVPFGNSDPAARLQRFVDDGEFGYNEVVNAINSDPVRRQISKMQTCDAAGLHVQQRANEDAAHRVVGMCIETRPELITPVSLAFLRDLGCTKLQIGIQSLDPAVLDFMGRINGPSEIENALSLLRLFGFKSHIHMMANLPGATPESDKQDYKRLVTENGFLPDEVKLYPCSLVASARLTGMFENGEWRPYGEDELVDVLVHDLIVTPAHTRISRMIRDISSKDIVAGNKKTNLRQMVEQEAERRGTSIREMRHREISTSDADPDALLMGEIRYTASNTEEVFIQFTDSQDRLAAFCRLSLPCQEDVRRLSEDYGEECESLPKDGFSPENERLCRECPIHINEAMIREVHVYGRVSRLHEAKEGSQHLGLGRAMVQRACDIAKDAGYESIAVISAVGTRGYYRNLGFKDRGLYQRMRL